MQPRNCGPQRLAATHDARATAVPGGLQHSATCNPPDCLESILLALLPVSIETRLALAPPSVTKPCAVGVLTQWVATRAIDRDEGNGAVMTTTEPGNMANAECLPPAVAMAGVIQPRRIDGFELQCVVCGGPFMALRRDRRTCSDACARSDQTARRKAREVVDGRPCTECGRIFVGGCADRRYCCGRCRARAYRRRKAGKRGLVMP